MRIDSPLMTNTVATGSFSGSFTGDGTGLTGVVGIPVGSDTQVQFNNNGSFGGSSNLTFDGTNLTVGGKVTATEIVTNIISQSISFATGSNIFGDEITDTHTFTGSLLVTGSTHSISGNVGIGTTSPGGLLHVSSGTSGDAVVVIESDTDDSDNADNPHIEFRQDGNTIRGKIGLEGTAGQTYSNSRSNATYLGSIFEQPVQIITGDTGGVQTAKITIDPNNGSDAFGYVGIGTTSPTQKLHISGSTTDVGIRIDNSATNGRDWFLYSRAASGVKFSIYDFDASADRLGIDENGNVGIGTITPDEKLTVEGTISGSACIMVGSGHRILYGSVSSITGGENNTILGGCGFIGGGKNNCIDLLDHASVIVGGCDNFVDGDKVAIVGGNLNTGSTNNSFIGGGGNNSVYGSYSSIVGGRYNCIYVFESYSNIGGGQCNCIDSDCSTIGGGCNNKIFYSLGTIGGGNGNIVCGLYSTIGGGSCNTTCTGESYATIGGGRRNTVDGDCSTIAGGACNLITANAAIVAGGTNNTGSGACSGILGGANNTGSGACSGILGGKNNHAAHDNSFIVGSDLSSTAVCYTFMNNACVAGTTRTTTLVETSARKYKECILPLEDQIENIKKLEPVEFQWKKDKTKDIGFIAEDVLKVYPDLIAYEEDGEINGIQYSKLTTVLVKALQQQQDQIEELKEEVKLLKQNK